jgi:hypothetical protein
MRECVDRATPQFVVARLCSNDMCFDVTPPDSRIRKQMSETPATWDE